MRNDTFSLFNRFKIEGKSLIHQAVQQQWPETLTLDFKEVMNEPGKEREYQNSLAEGLSGFANSSGGLLIWGVSARKMEGEPDAAEALKPIRRVDIFFSNLLSYTGQVVSPAVIDADHELIYEDEEARTGYVVTFVPEATGHPHMGLCRKDRSYWCRSGGSFQRMEHYMVADRFSRAAKPELEFVCSIRQSTNSSERSETAFVDIVVGIKNVGPVIALYPALGVDGGGKLSNAPYGLDGNYNQGLPLQPLASDRERRAYQLYAGGVNNAVHPGVTIEVARYHFRMPMNMGSVALELNYDLYCQGFQKTGKHQISGRQVLTIAASL